MWLDCETNYSLADYHTGERVNEAAIKRLRLVNERAEAVYVSFSGGKDSTALLELAVKAIDADKLHVVFFDTESETPDTHEFVQATKIAIEAQKLATFHWVYGNYLVRNATKQYGYGLFKAFESEPYLWQPPIDAERFDAQQKTITWVRDAWIRRQAKRYQGEVWQLIGITKYESLNRLMATTKERKGNKDGLTWTTVDAKNGVIKGYPVYDWRASDVAQFIRSGQFGVNDYYRKMYKATGAPVSMIRTENVLHGCGLRELRIIQKLYPEFWAKMQERGLIGDEWGNKHARKKEPRRADGTALAERWAKLL